MNIVLLSMLAVLIIYLQIKFSKREGISLKLLLPIIFFILSFRLIFNINTEVEVYGKMIKLVDENLIILRSIGIFSILNIPTVVLLTVGFSDNNKLIDKIKKSTKVLD